MTVRNNVGNAINEMKSEFKSEIHDINKKLDNVLKAYESKKTAKPKEYAEPAKEEEFDMKAEFESNLRAENEARKIEDDQH